MTRNITWQIAKARAKKERDIWVRRLVCDPITTPLAYLLARYTHVEPFHVALFTFLVGITAAGWFWSGHLWEGAIAYAFSFLSDSLDGKLNRVLDIDDTYRGMIDFLLDGIVCFAVVVALAWYSRHYQLTLLLLGWMGLHYLDMRFTSALYRLKAQAGERDVWLIGKEKKGILGKYTAFVKRFRTYPHPTLGEGVVLMFIVGPVLWHFIGIEWQGWMVILGIAFILPETLGAAILALKQAKETKQCGT